MPVMRVLTFVAAVLISASGSLAADGSRAPTTQPTADMNQSIASRVDAVLRKDVLGKWFPAAVDRQGGGFFENFGTDWSREAPNDRRSIVYQARLTWLAARASLHCPDRGNDYREITLHGVRFLAARQWDARRGGFFWSVDVAGRPTEDRPNEKHVYGIAFGIYAAATAYEATQDPAALDLARRAFTWLEAHAHDATNGGYFEALTPEGTPITAGTPGNDAIGTRYGRKSMNTHIHVLEALDALYHAWPDQTVRARLQEVFEMVRDKVYAEPGCLTLYLTPDWQRLPGPDSYGHDVETAYLLVEAAATLGMPDDARTWTIARRLVDHALRFGWDDQHGGFYNEGTADGADLDTTKVWWVQAEGLNALLRMHERFGGDDPRYRRAFARQWAFISHHQIDPAHGGWYPKVTADGTPGPQQIKSDPWTEGYHQGRALMNVSRTLQRIGEPEWKKE